MYPRLPTAQHLLDSNILAYREDVEELTGAAVKEEMIEVKLAQLKADWANYNLAFAEYKTRGPVILKPSDTSELMEKLEESQMTLGSMSTNRWVCWCIGAPRTVLSYVSRSALTASPLAGTRPIVGYTPVRASERA